jgi:nucleotide-binding universal stress UspA family protein
MDLQTKCLLLPIDESAECLRPITFLTRLYPQREHLRLILCHFHAPLAPVYRQRDLPPALAARKAELLKAQKDATQAVLAGAREALMAAGFPPEQIQDHAQERSVSAAQHACSLAGIKKVNGVLVQKLISGKLEGLLRGDPAPGLLSHCLASPIWFLEGQIDPSRAAICLQAEQASLRAVNHAADMLAASATRIELLHCDKSRQTPLHLALWQPGPEFRTWELTPGGKAIRPFLEKAREILLAAGIAAERVSLTLLPGRQAVADEILAHCYRHNIGIVALGHSKPSGTWSFFEDSVTRTVLAEFKNLAVWVVQ